jgi:hypothetical protein
MTLQPNLHPRLLGLVLQSNPLKLGSCKFNIIINIINIILGSDIAAKPKALGYNFTEKHNTLRFFYIHFYAKKNKINL